MEGVAELIPLNALVNNTHEPTGSRDKAMDVQEQFAGKEHLGLGLDTIDTNALTYGDNSRSLVPEVGLEPT